jgi:hypothetical protein
MMVFSFPILPIKAYLNESLAILDHNITSIIAQLFLFSI